MGVFYFLFSPWGNDPIRPAYFSDGLKPPPTIGIKTGGWCVFFASGQAQPKFLSFFKTNRKSFGPHFSREKSELQHNIMN